MIKLYEIKTAVGGGNIVIAIDKKPKMKEIIEMREYGNRGWLISAI